jgi:rare lipoprotein A
MKKKTNIILAVILGLQLLVIAPVIAESATGIGSEEISQGQSSLVIDSLHTQEPPCTETMVTTYYSRRFHGRKTASGERYSSDALTCAHRSLPFNTVLKITNPKNGNSVIVKVNDRGPFSKGRQLDVSYAAAKELGMLRAGVLPMEVQILPPDTVDSQKVTVEPSDRLAQR